MTSHTMKDVAKKEVKAHEKRMHGAKKMRAGGKTNADMMKYGRNMAKVMNQRSPMRPASKKTGI